MSNPSAPTDTASFSQYARHPGALALTAAVTALLCFWLWQRYTHVNTDDARIAASMVSVSSKAAGRLVEFPVSSGDVLKRGQLIGQLDARDIELRTRELESQLAAMNSPLERASLEVGQVRGEVTGTIHAAESALQAVQARRAAAEADLNFKQSEWQRVGRCATSRCCRARSGRAPATRWNRPGASCSGRKPRWPAPAPNSTRPARSTPAAR